MKKPELKDLSEAGQAETPTTQVDQLRTAVQAETDKANEVVRRTFSYERFLDDHINAVALQLSQEQGKTVNASQALRAILKRDMEAGR